jgi:serine/threonine-protein kinase
VRQHAERQAEAGRREEALRKDVGLALAQAVTFRDGFHFREAHELLEQARQHLEPAGPDDLRRQLDQARADLDLAAKLDAARLQAATNDEGRFDFAGAELLYAAAFAEAGLGQEGDNVEAVAARVRASAVRGALVAALDDWAVCAAVKDRPAWLLRVARRVDPDPEGWRDRARDPVAWGNAAALAELVRNAPRAGQPLPLLLALGQRLHATGVDSTELLRRLQRQHPADFWANLTLGNALKYQVPGEAIGYYRVALGIRPEAAVSYYNLGEVLKIQGWLDEAIGYYQQALRIDPRHVWAHINLGNALKEKGRLDETFDHFQQAVLIDPRNLWARVYLGNALRDRGRLDEASEHFQQAITLDPNSTLPLNGLRSILMRQGRAEEVRISWQKVLAANPPEHPAWFGYAELCLFLGKEEEYRRACRALLDRFGESTDRFTAERTGRACLLLPAAEDELRKALVLADRAVAGRRPEDGWAYPYFLFVEGLAAYRRGHPDHAIALLGGDPARAMQPAGRLILAMAQYRQGQKEAACKTLAAAILAFDWSADQADNHDAWMCHVLRREAEAMLLPNLPAFLQGKYQPQDNAERIALLGACQFKGLRCTAARLYADALTADPKLADDLQVDHRYRAARFAALAAASQRKAADAQQLDDKERARWRKQALDWLRADLAAWAKATDRVLLQARLRHWQQDAELAGVHDHEALAKLPQGERAAWSQFWSGVADLLQKTGGETEP